MISIVTVVLNDLEGLKRTYASIESQNNDSYEWIVVDGGSADGAQSFLGGLTNEKLKWISEKDRGIYDGMNKGISIAKQDYIVFLNAGDVFSTPEVLDLVVAKLKDENYPTVLYGGANYAFPSGYLRYRGPRTPESSIWHGLPAVHQATYYKREVLADIQYDLQYTICSDYYMDASLYVRNTSYALLAKPLADKEVGGTSYENPWKMTVQPYKIQRDVLGVSLARRVLSAVKRKYSRLGLTVFLSRFGSLFFLVRCRK